jgi:bacterial/archaeal transporter family-2 protein
MTLGLLFSVVAGTLVSLQNIFNSNVSERAGSWATTTLVLGLGFLASLSIGLFFEGRHLFNLQHMQPWFWFSGIIGVGVVTCIVQGIKRLGPTYAISIALTSQLVFALWWDSIGWLGLDKVPFTLKQAIGVFVIICGIIVFKFGSRQKNQEITKVA